MNSKKISVILLSYYSGNRLINCTEKITALLNKENIPFEIIIMDDGSKDNSFEIAESLEKKYPNVRAYQLSRNYTSHYSIFAGFSVCEGACATITPDDEQQPYELIVQSYRLWEQGQKLVIQYREERGDNFFAKLASTWFYRIMNHLSDVALPPKGTDSFLIDRELIDILNTRIHPINTTTVTEILRLGFNPYYLPFARPKGINQKSRWTFKKKVKLAKDFFYSSSTFPIKLISTLGMLLSGFSVAFMIFYLYVKLFGNSNYWKLNEVPGWTSLVLLITFFSGLILFSLGIIAEYIWRIYEEVKNRPGYIIKQKNK